MSILLETTLGDIVIDLDVEGSPTLAMNVLKLVKARYYTNTLIYNILPGRYCQCGDPKGNGTGGGCIYGLLDSSVDNSIEKSSKRFLRSRGRELTSRKELQQRGRVVAVEMNGIPNTIGSQFLITLEEGPMRALDGLTTESRQEQQDAISKNQRFFSLGTVVEDDEGVLEKIQAAYCDANGRPYADIRIIRALVVHDSYKDPPGMDELLKQRGVLTNNKEQVVASPDYDRPPEEVVEHRIQANEVDADEEETAEKSRKREEEIHKREDKSRAVVLEMLGDLPSADIKAPENVLFVCKLNPVTDDEDLELIFSRFDPKCKAEIIRDSETGASLQYAFVEFNDKQKCVEAYFKMNNALVDDRRIKVDFSQSVAKVWDKYAQRMRTPGQNPRGGGRKHIDNIGGDRPHYGNSSNHREQHARRDHDRRPHGERSHRWGQPPSRTNGGVQPDRSSPRGDTQEYGRHNERSPLSPRGDDRYERHRHGNDHSRERRRSRSPSFDRDSRSRSRSNDSDGSRSHKHRKRKHHRRRKERRHRHRHHRHDDEDRHGRHRHHRDRRKENRKGRYDDKDHKRKRKRRSRSRSVSD